MQFFHSEDRLWLDRIRFQSAARTGFYGWILERDSTSSDQHIGMKQVEIWGIKLTSAELYPQKVRSKICHWASPIRDLELQ